MANPVIKVEALSKKFIISHEGRERYTTLRDTISRGVKRLTSGSVSNGRREEFWALKDLDFEINAGDRVGIIGRNGAGKSTLLKVLSRITEPTSGRVNIRGRVASLLEVGTGFHPELTGRENIFLNGAILGMSRAEIRAKFDEIVAFADVERFLDTPVKRYSSGMFVRLAFAVAAHLEPEILIVDEVLAVGDAQFQKKCLGKMEEVSSKDGRTVLFVSHNMGMIKSLCTSAIFLHKGQKVLQGDVFESLAKYISFDQAQLNTSAKYLREGEPLGKKMYIKEVEFVDDQTLPHFQMQVNLVVRSTIDTRIGVNLRLKDGMGFPVGYGFSNYFAPECTPVKEGDTRISLTTLPIYLATGTYKLTVELVYPGVEMLDLLEDCLLFELSNDGLHNRGYGVRQEWGYGATEIKINYVEYNSSPKQS
ncbi:MAG TPA: polysaccharide ABC transporter ATP-binding protein [Puia sp.]|jgi:lipopolysaccharide transport system ATP-binding protein|nr:polysaccharide ABC transporter ATP-binding protein [Puia sp.]